MLAGLFVALVLYVIARLAFGAASFFVRTFPMLTALVLLGLIVHACVMAGP